MLARTLLRDDTGRTARALAARGVDAGVLERWQELDGERRAGLVEIEDLKRRRNEASRDIGRVKREGGDAEAQIAAVSEIKARVEQLQGRLDRLEEELG